MLTEKYLVYDFYYWFYMIPIIINRLNDVIIFIPTNIIVSLIFNFKRYAYLFFCI